MTVEKAKLAHGAKSTCREVRVLLESLRELVASVDAQRVGMAFVAVIQFYTFLHGDHGIGADTLDAQARSKKGDEAVALAITMQRAMLALIGTHRRRTYAHDLVYGTWQLYMLFGKPWNAATEGNEHAHQDMKAFFHDMGYDDGYEMYKVCVF